jgi:hypothetical protein
MWRTLISAFLALALASCGGDGDKNEAVSGIPPAITATAAAAATASESRPQVEEQLAIIDGNRMPEQYRDVLEALGRKCSETPVEVADAVVSERTRLQNERMISITVLDYLRGVNSVIPDGRTGVPCRDLAAELGDTIGR